MSNIWYYLRYEEDSVRGCIYPPTGPDHQISLTQITNHKKKNSLITKILMYYENVNSCLHAAHW